MKIKIFILVLLTVLVSCSKLEKERKQADPVTVRVMKVDMDRHVSQHIFVGTVKASAEVSVMAKYSGRLSEMKVKQGDNVTAGQILAVVDSHTLQSAYDMAQATLRQAEDGYERLMQVKATNSVPDIKVVDVETKLAQARAQAVVAAQSLEDCNLKAPFDGVVGDIHVVVGVELSVLQPVMTVFDVSSVEVHIAVPETEVVNYSVGDSALVEVPALGNKSVKAVIATKGVAASVVSHSYDFTLSLVGNSCGMMPGMVTKVYVEDADDISIVVPSSIVKMDSYGKYVWVVVDNVVEKRYIEIGGFAERGVKVSYGLKPGDLVIVDGSRKVSSGSEVFIKE
ncbi:MAG: efflux RND transporter periplasmic adaptor subunit [Candidatus Aphodosoma sp.]